MSKYSTCLIEPNALVREGFKSILIQAHDYDLLLEAEEPGILEDQPEADLIDIALIGVKCDSAIINHIIRQAKQAMPRAYVVAFLAGDSPQCIATVFAAGADGCLQNNISTAALPAYLNLVLLGEKVFPSSLARDMAENCDFLNGHAPKLQAYNLSIREIEIVRCLANGEPNKVIARHLNISEATVKVHIKAILRKLGLHNRTQAALWAIRHNMIDSVKLAPELEKNAAQLEHVNIFKQDVMS